MSDPFISRHCGVPFSALALAAFWVAVPPAQAQDVNAGRKVFNDNCAVCHSVKPGQGSVGPNLHGVFGRLAGTVPKYAYTSALANSHILWNEADLDRFLTNPSAMVPGTAMSVSLSSPADRANLIAYFKTLGPPDPAPDALAKKPATPVGSGPTQAELDAADDRSDWLNTNKGYRAERYSALDKINRGNAANLRPICSYQPGFTGQHQTYPLVYEGVIYLTSTSATAAVNATTCEQLWSQSFKLEPNIRVVNRGAAIAQGRLVRGTPDGRIVALNMKDGSVIWEVKVTDKTESGFIPQPPTIADGKVFIGPAGSDWALQGWVGAFDLATGKELWRFNLVPKDGEAGADTWKRRDTKRYGGGAIWTAMAYDRANNLLLVPVGNPAPDFSPNDRPGDNLYTGSVVALHGATGKLAWYKQFVVHDGHDFDMTSARPLFSANVQGKQRNLLTVAGKDGLLRLMDRDTREVLYEKAFSRRENLDKPVTPAGVHACPGNLGGSMWAGASYDPKRSITFVGSSELCGTYSSGPLEDHPGTGKYYMGGNFVPDNDGKPAGRLTAFDTLTGAIKWQQEWTTPALAGLVSTAGGVLITGKTDGDFLVMDSETGQTLYKFRSGQGFASGPVTYEVNGHQYIALVSGVASAHFAGRGTLELTIFELPPGQMTAAK